MRGPKPPVPPVPRAPRSPRPPFTPAAHLDESNLLSIVGYQLAQAGVVTDRVFDLHVGGPMDLRRLEFTVLALLRNNAGATARQLSRALAVTPPHIAVTIDRLSARGLVERERGTSDARVQHLSLSAAGATLVDRAVAALQAGEAEVMLSLSTAERAMLAELLHKAALSRR